MLKEARPYGQITIHYNIHIGLGEVHRLDLERIRCFMKPIRHAPCECSSRDPQEFQS